MPAGSLDFFSSARVNKISQGVYDPRLAPQPLVWDKRIPSVNAFDGEIMSRFIGFPVMADLIAPDAKAVMYSMGKFQFETTQIPKLKVGIGLNEEMLTMLDRLQGGLVTNDELGLFSDWEKRTISAVRYGVDMRRESLLIAMVLDNLSYDRMGIKMSNLTWGTYSDLKVTPSTPWDQTTATPITDIQTVRRLARIRYGINFNRMTLSTQALLYASKTTEFQNQMKSYVGSFLFGAPAPAIPTQSDGYIAGLLARILSGIPGDDNGGIGPMTIELDDRRAWIQELDGSNVQQPLWPITSVALTSTSNDGNPMAWDFANANIMEGTVSRIAGSMAPNVPSGPGPTVYPTLADPQLNAPGIGYWGVQRGFPRKHMLMASAALTVGTFSDTISTALPF